MVTSGTPLGSCRATMTRPSKVTPSPRALAARTSSAKPWRERADGDENIDLEVDAFCRDICESVRTIVAITIFNGKVSISDQSTLSQPHDKCRDGALFYRQRP